MDLTVEVHCSQCGSANYSLPSGSETESVIVCNDCGRDMGNVGGLVDELRQQLVAHSAEMLRRDIERLEGKQVPDLHRPS